MQATEARSLQIPRPRERVVWAKWCLLRLGQRQWLVSTALWQLAFLGGKQPEFVMEKIIPHWDNQVKSEQVRLRKSFDQTGHGGGGGARGSIQQRFSSSLFCKRPSSSFPARAGRPLVDVVRPAFPLPTTMSPVLQIKASRGKGLGPLSTGDSQKTDMNFVIVSHCPQNRLVSCGTRPARCVSGVF